ncbi:hypothetical protein NBRC116494_05610 [Aurantivibrio plasticivorans]
MSKTAIIIDSAGSLPGSVCKKYNISFVPLTYTVNGDTQTDPCDEKAASELFTSNAFNRKNDVYTTPPTVDDFENAILKKIEEGYNRIIVQTVNRTQGETYSNANAALARVNKKLTDKSVTVRIMDSRTAFAGQGLMAIETIRRLLKEKSDDAVRRKMDKLSEKIHTFILPKEVRIAQKRSKTRNENSVSTSQAFIADTLGIHPIVCNVNDSTHSPAKIRGFNKAAQALFSHASKCIESGLYSPIITVTYAGPLSELKELPGYKALSEKAAAKKLMLVPTVASLAAGIYTSPGSLSLALAAEPQEWS